MNPQGRVRAAALVFALVALPSALVSVPSARCQAQAGATMPPTVAPQADLPIDARKDEASTDDVASPDDEAITDDEAMGAVELTPDLELLPEDKRPSVAATLTPTEDVHLGDALTLTVTVKAKEGDQVTVPEQTLAPFEILGQEPPARAVEGNAQTVVFTLKLISFTAGKAFVGPVKLRVVTADGTIGTAVTDAIEVEVKSLIANEPEAQLKPETPPVVVLEEDYTLAYVGGFLLAAALFGFLFVFASRLWARRNRSEPPPPPPRPAHDIAYEALEKLRRDLRFELDAGEGMRWADGLSDTLRAYLGARYAFDGLECTTDEVVQNLRRMNPRGLAIEEVVALLGECDLVKFAKGELELPQGESMVEAVIRIVDRTRLREADMNVAQANTGASSEANR